MSILDTVKAALTSDGTSTGRATDGSKGAYWCDDCDVRVRDVDLDGEPVCPDCGDEMRFERSKGRSCAC